MSNKCLSSLFVVIYFLLPITVSATSDTCSSCVSIIIKHIDGSIQYKSVSEINRSFVETDSTLLYGIAFKGKYDSLDYKIIEMCDLPIEKDSMFSSSENDVDNYIEYRGIFSHIPDNDYDDKYLLFVLDGIEVVDILYLELKSSNKKYRDTFPP